MKSWKTPTTKEVDQTVGLLNQPAQKSYFFDNLKNPAWIKPLYDKGFFKDAPAIKRNEKEGTIQFPIWPESKFLARVAPEADPEILIKIIQDFKTDNVRVMEDVLEIISKLPSDFILKVYKNAIKYLEDPYIHFSLVPQKIAEIVEKLSLENKTDEAIEVASFLLRPMPEPQSEEAKKIGLNINPKPKFEIWDYEQIVKKNLEPLKVKESLRSFDLFVNLLYTAIVISRSENTDKSDTEDYLYISRRSVRDEPQSHSHELESILISQIVSAANIAIKSDSKNLDLILKTLEAKKYNYFRKITLYLLGEYPNLDTGRVSSYLKNKVFFDTGWISAEYEYLLSNNFGQLSAEDKGTITSWIEQGPNLEVFVNSEKSWSGNTPTEERIERYKETWQLRHLHVIRASIDGNLKDKYLALSAKYPGFDEKIHEGISYALNESPKTKDELMDMSIEQIVNLLKEWVPSGDGFNGKPTKDGLSNVLREVAKEKIASFSQKAADLKDLDSNYLFSILFGIQNGLSNNKEVAWEEILKLLHHIFINSNDEHSFDNSVRRQALSVLEQGLKLNGFKVEDRETIWSIIQHALKDTDPTLDQDEKFEDGITLAINSVRGEALHSVIEYALWLRRLVEKEPNNSKLISSGFDEMPEVREILDNYLELDIEPTKAIRSVYGRYLPWIHLLDQNWTKENSEKIFSHSEKAHGNEAWETFVCLTSPYDNLLPLLKGEYHYRLMNAEFPDDKKQSIREPNQRLVEHIMAYYWRGKIKIDDALINDLILSADVRLLSHAISFLGRVVYSEKNTPVDVLNKLKEFWEYTISKILADKTRQGALEGFTWWFASNKFEKEWLLNNLELVIDNVRHVDSEDFAIDNLVVLAQDFPERSVIILEKILEVASKPWIAHTSEKEIIEILKIAQSSQSPVAQEVSKRIVNSLAKKQLFKFLDVLKK